MKGLGQLQDHQVLTTLLVTEGEPEVSAALILIVMTASPSHESSEKETSKDIYLQLCCLGPQFLSSGDQALFDPEWAS